ncbi:MAG: PIN domain-containing protein [Euryarchaeota archaeon]|nr:PIN domain-containing protein [Euryarchaeota archaeon]
MPVLDATFLIDSKHRPASIRPALARLRQLPGPIFVPMQAAIEYCVGASDANAAITDLALFFELVPCDTQIVREAASVAREARERGKNLSWSDLQVAATARYFGTFVVSTDRRAFGPDSVVPAWDYEREKDLPGTHES